MKKGIRFTLWAMALVFSLLFASQVATAEELPQVASAHCLSLVPLEETEFTRSDAIQLLGVNEKDAKKMSFYVADTAQAEISNPNAEFSTSGVGIEPGEQHVFPTFTFSGTNVGSYWTCKGTQLTWAIIYHSAADRNAAIHVFLYGYGRENPDNIFDGCTWYTLNLAVGDVYRLDGYISSPKDYDYHFIYYCGNQSRVTVIVGVL